MSELARSDAPPTLRRGWTTGSCATAAAAAAASRLWQGVWLDEVTIDLPRGGRARFAIEEPNEGIEWTSAAVRKDAGDDPDVTHGCLVRVRVDLAPAGSDLVFRAGEGVGTVTRPGLPIEVGEAAINPVPRRCIADAIEEIAVSAGAAADAVVTVSIPGGAEIAQRTLNPRLGIVGGLSILGTTGVVIPFSCSSWIHSIHRGIDVARATGTEHVAAVTGSTSEAALQRLFSFPDHALLDMGDFIGATLKYLKRHPLPRVTIGGGFAKLVKFSQGADDLHNSRSRVDFDALAALVIERGGDDVLAARVRRANTAMEVLAITSQLDLPVCVAERVRARASSILDGAAQVDAAIVDRTGNVVAHVGP